MDSDLGLGTVLRRRSETEIGYRRCALGDKIARWGLKIISP